jgi:hypothetical protein
VIFISMTTQPLLLLVYSFGYVSFINAAGIKQ